MGFKVDSTGKVIASGIDLDTNTATSVAPGVTGTDAVNKNQLDTEISGVGSSSGGGYNIMIDYTYGGAFLHTASTNFKSKLNIPPLYIINETGEFNITNAISDDTIEFTNENDCAYCTPTFDGGTITFSVDLLSNVPDNSFIIAIAGPDDLNYIGVQSYLTIWNGFIINYGYQLGIAIGTTSQMEIPNIKSSGEIEGTYTKLNLNSTCITNQNTTTLIEENDKFLISDSEDLNNLKYVTALSILNYCYDETAGDLYIFGGRSATSTFDSGEKYSYNDDLWSSIPTMPGPTRYQNSASGKGNLIYNIGGTEGAFGSSYISDNDEFNSLTNIWNSKADLISAVYHPVYDITTIEDYIYSPSTRYDNIYDSFSSITMVTKGTLDSNFITIKNEGYIFHRSSDNATYGNEIFNDKYKIDTNSWENKTSYPYAQLVNGVSSFYNDYG